MSLADMGRIADDHNAASRAIRNRFAEVDRATTAATRAMVAQSRRVRDEPHDEKPVAPVVRTRVEDDEEEFPMPKSWLV